jgi:hypothetical protein
MLKPDGHLLPSGLTLWVAGASQSEFRGQHAKIRDNADGLDLSRFGYLMNHDVRHLPRAERCTASAVFAEIDLGTEEPAQLSATVELAAVEPGLVDGIAGWFSVTLVDGVELTNSPFAAERIERNHIFLPFTQALQLNAGERLELTLTLLTRQEFYAWRVKHLDAAGRVVGDFKQTSLAPSLLERGVLEQAADEHVPRLNARGTLERSILSLCDGARSLSQLVDAVFEAHRSELPSRERAAEAVAKALRRNTQ